MGVLRLISFSPKCSVTHSRQIFLRVRCCFALQEPHVFLICPSQTGELLSKAFQASDVPVHGDSYGGPVGVLNPYGAYDAVRAHGTPFCPYLAV